MKNNEPDNTTSGTESTFNRRAFVKGAGFAGLGLAGTALVAGKLGVMDQIPSASALKPSSVEAATYSDTDILNFALNLEYLEAEFYTVALTGKRISAFGIPETGVGDYGPTTGGMQLDYRGSPLGSASGPAIVAELAETERQHVLDLRAVLGSAAIAKPAINLDALGIGFANYQQFLELARAFEDTGVSAYGGAAPLISSKEILSAAVRIGLVEAYHSGNIRLLIAETNTPTMPLDSRDVLPPPSGSKYAAMNSQALAIVRTFSQVLAIVYHNSAPGTNRGGFFPSGVNGRINTV